MLKLFPTTPFFMLFFPSSENPPNFELDSLLKILCSGTMVIFVPSRGSVCNTPSKATMEQPGNPERCDAS